MKIQYIIRRLRGSIRLTQPYFIASVVFVVAAVASGFMIQWLDNERLNIEKIHTSEMASDYTITVQNAIERALSATYAISALVQQGNGTVENFDQIAEKMLPLYPGIDSLQLAPNGVVRQVVPLAGNETAIGHNLFADEKRAKEARLARDTHKLTFAGPFKMIQGPFFGGIGRLPIYLIHENGDSSFWGFCNVVIRFPEVFQRTGLLQLEDRGFAYELWRYHPDTGQKQIIAASASALASEPVERTLEVPGATWVLSITPKKGWSDSQGLLYKIAIGMLFCFMMAWLAKLTVDLRVRKKQLEQMAFLDPLTKLPNRRLLTERLEQALAYAQRNGNMVAVCFLDIDGFKAVNDQYGHAVGDQLLVHVANTMKACLRQGDTLARVGGDEFVFVLQDVPNIMACEHILDRILQAASSPCNFHEQEFVVSISVGVALYPEDDNDGDMLLRHADYAMYKAKQAGKGRYCFFYVEL